MAFVVESNVVDRSGRAGVARLYVASEGRAKDLVEDGRVAGVLRSYREIAPEDMPARARANLERAAKE